MAYSIVGTCIDLDKYALVREIHPIMFNGGTLESCPDSRYDLTCDHVWFQNNFKMNNRENLARQLNIAVSQFRDILGAYPCPTHTCNEFHSLNSRSQCPEIYLRNGQFIAGGVFTRLDMRGDVTVTRLTDDCYRVQITNIPQVAMPQHCCEIRIYHKGNTLADCDNNKREIRGCVTCDINQTQRTVTIEIPSYKLYKPSLLEGSLIKMAQPVPLCCNQDIFVNDVDVFREYIDPTKPAIEFIKETQCHCRWTHGNYYGYSHDCNCNDGCACKEETLPGCIEAINPRCSKVRLRVAQYDTAKQCFVSTSQCDPCGMGYMGVRVNYLSGFQSEDCPNVHCRDANSRLLEALSLLATARTPGLCGCTCNYGDLGNLTGFMNQVNRESRFELNRIDFNNPFGNRLGEVLAYRMIKDFPTCHASIRDF